MTNEWLQKAKLWHSAIIQNPQLQRPPLQPCRHHEVFFSSLFPPGTHSFSWHIIPSIKYRPTESRFCPSKKKNHAPSHSGKGLHWFALRCSGLLPDHRFGHLCSLYPFYQTLTQSCLDFAGLESKSLLRWPCFPLRPIIKWYPYVDMWGI